MCEEDTGKRNTSSKTVMLLTSDFVPLFRIDSLIARIAIFNKWPLEGKVGSYRMP